MAKKVVLKKAGGNESSRLTDIPSVFVVKPPADDDSKYILMVTRGNPFGGGSTTAFGVDGVFVENDTSGRGYCLRGWRGVSREIVVEFPLGSNYMMIRRVDLRLISPRQMAEEQFQEDKEMHDLQEKLGGEEAKDAPTEARSGQYL